MKVRVVKIETMDSEFRHWVADMWRRNCDEHDLFHEDRHAMKDYFKMYKFWLKREFRYQKSQGNI